MIKAHSHRGLYNMAATTSLVLTGLLVALTAAQTKEDGPKSYCSSEAFDVTCGKNEVILMQSALYGRMEPGRCISGDYTHSVGCYADMLAYMDTRCSGRRSCKVVIGTLEQVAQPCNKDFKSYMEASYLCVAVTSTAIGSCSSKNPVELSPPTGYLGRDTLLESGRYLTNCLWNVNVPAGQTIALTLYTFNTPPPPKPEVMYTPCSWYVVIREGDRSTEFDLCNGDQRERPIYRSDGSNVDLSFYGMEAEESIPHFILEYNAVGCADMDPPQHAWSRREGDNLMVKCNETGETWYLTCRDNEWIGDVGNCSQKGAPTVVERIRSDKNFLQEGIVFAVFIGLILGLVMGVAMLAVVFCCKRRIAQQTAESPDSQGMEIRPGHMSYPGLLTQEKPIGGNVCEYTHVWEVRPQPFGTTGTFKDAGDDTSKDLSTITKGGRLYEPRMLTDRPDTFHICRKGDAPLYFELDPHTGHTCTS